MVKRGASQLSLLLLLSLLQLSTPLKGEGRVTWSLEKAIEEAVIKNLQLERERLAIEESRVVLKGQKWSSYPTLYLSFNHSLNWGRSVNLQDLEIVEDRVDQVSSLSLAAELTLFDGFKIERGVKLAKSEIESATFRYLVAKNRVIINVTRAYLQLLLSEELLSVAKESVESTLEQLSHTEKLVRGGIVPISSKLEVEGQLANERAELIEAKNEVAKGELTFRELLSLPQEEVVKLEQIKEEELLLEEELLEQKGLIVGRDSLSLEELLSYSSALPQLELKKLTKEEAELKVIIAKGGYYPTLSLTGGYGSYATGANRVALLEQFRESANPSLLLSFTLPIVGRRAIRSAVERATLEVKRRELELKEERQILNRELEELYRELLSFKEQVVASQRGVELFEESLKHVVAKLKQGMATGSDYSIAKSNLFKAHSKLLRAKYQYLFQLKIVEFYRGLHRGG